MRWPTVALGELFAEGVPSIDPQRFADEMFELWSIPAFDEGEPTIVKGSSIGSAKKCVRPNDVLLSRIVPHIRRAWVVSEGGGRRKIGSGEWIVFRSRQFIPSYLRHVLISDEFHASFMGTVAGVGGSLLRARPEAVKRLKIPLPPLDEQRRIAAILDQADALRRAASTSAQRLKDLEKAYFVALFEDLNVYPKTAFGDLVDNQRIGLVRGAEEFGRDMSHPYIRMDAITRGGDILGREPING